MKLLCVRVYVSCDRKMALSWKREEPIPTQMIKKCSEEQDEEEEDLGLDEEIDENGANGEDE